MKKKTHKKIQTKLGHTACSRRLQHPQELVKSCPKGGNFSSIFSGRTHKTINYIKQIALLWGAFSTSCGGLYLSEKWLCRNVHGAAGCAGPVAGAGASEGAGAGVAVHCRAVQVQGPKTWQRTVVVGRHPILYLLIWTIQRYLTITFIFSKVWQLCFQHGP